MKIPQLNVDPIVQKTFEAYYSLIQARRIDVIQDNLAAQDWAKVGPTLKMEPEQAIEAVLQENSCPDLSVIRSHVQAFVDTCDARDINFPRALISLGIAIESQPILSGKIKDALCEVPGYSPEEIQPYLLAYNDSANTLRKKNFKLALGCLLSDAFVIVFPLRLMGMPGTTLPIVIAIVLAIAFVAWQFTLTVLYLSSIPYLAIGKIAGISKLNSWIFAQKIKSTHNP